MTRYTPLWLQQGSYAASVDRRLVGALWPVAATAGGVATVSGGTMSVSVAAGSAAVPTQNNTGTTLCVWDAPELVTHAAAPGAPNSRIDVITVHPRGNDLDSGSNNDFIMDIVQGTPAASPAAPAVPAGQVGLYQVMIPSGAAALVPANLTDVRPGGLSVPASGAGSPPRGYVGGAFGPASAFNAATGTIMAVAVPVTAGRRYRVDAYCLGTQQGSTSSTFVAMTDSGGYFNANLWRIWSQAGLPANNNGAGGSSRTFVATATGTVTITMNASAGAGTLQVSANWAWITVEDIGT